jgi:chaperonin cofactor prefoldin
MSRWQLRSIHLYSHDERVRGISFELNAVNIITGSSGSGKSALCEIIDYCFGAGECHIPGRVRDSTTWVALLLSNGSTEAFVARRIPPPDQSSTDECAFFVSAQIPIPSAASKIDGTTNTRTVVHRLEQLFGIGNVTTETFSNLKQPKRISARHVMPFLLQDDDVIINKTVLLRGAQDQHRFDIIDSFPYFLGISDEQSLAKEAELKLLSKQLQSEENRLSGLESRRDYIETNLREIAAEAQAVGFITYSVQDATASLLKTSLSEIAVWNPNSANEDPNDRISELDESRRQLIRQKSQLANEINETQEALREATRFAATSARQTRRLQTVELYEKFPTPMTACPVCSNNIFENTATLEQLRTEYSELSKQLSGVERERPQLDSYVTRLQAEIDALSLRLDGVRAEIRGVLSQTGAIQEELDRSQQRIRVAGRVSYFLDVTATSEKVISFAKRDELRQKVEDLEIAVNVSSKMDRLQDAQREIGSEADLLLSNLPFPADYPKHSVYLNTRDLSAGVITQQRRVPMRDIGSDENYLSLHVSVLLALHRYFKIHKRPVPGFIVFDQLSRPFYPPDKMPGIVTSRSHEERFELKQYFDALYQEVATQKDLQIIVLEHAFFADDERFLKAAQGRSLEGTKLIPEDWPVIKMDSTKPTSPEA